MELVLQLFHGYPQVLEVVDFLLEVVEEEYIRDQELLEDREVVGPVLLNRRELLIMELLIPAAVVVVALDHPEELEDLVSF